MPPASIAQTNFNSGELGPRMAGRPDLAAYQNGLAEMTNFVPLIQGPVVKRPGTIHVAPAASQSERARLIAWTPRLTQAYVVEASPLKLRYFTNDALIESSPGVPVETVTPWTASDLAGLNWATSSDVIYMVDGVRALRRLLRTTATSFSLTVPELTGGPFKDQNSTPATTVYASAATGTVTVTASAAVFQAGHVGSLFRIEAQDFASIPAWEPGITVTAGEKRRSDGKVYAAGTTGRTGSVQPTHSRGTEYDGMASGTDINSQPAGGVQWIYESGNFGIVKITAFASATSVTATVVKTLPSRVVGGGNATWRWSHALFSDVEGWPQVVALWNERLWLSRGNRIVGSVVGDLLNFAGETDAGLVTADMAINIALAEADDIIWMLGDRNALLVGTATAEYAIGGLNNGQAVGPGNIAAARQSRYGNANVRPQPAGTRTLFMQRGRRKLRQMGYSFENDRYIAPDLTVRAHHISRSGIIELAMQNEPEALLWALRSDGRLLALTFSEDEDVRGWSQQPVAGIASAVESIACIPAPDGGSDQLWLAVRRIVNGGTVRHIERLAPFREDNEGLPEAIHLDASLTYRGAPASTFAQLGHLEGEQVAALVDGAVVRPLFVADGSVTLPTGLSGSIVHIGLPFTARIRTMKMERTDGMGPAQGRLQKVTRLIVRVLDTLGLRVAGNDNHFDALRLRPDNFPTEAAVPPYSGDDSLPFPGGYGREAVVVIESDTPLPATVLALFPSIDVGGT